MNEPALMNEDGAGPPPAALSERLLAWLVDLLVVGVTAGAAGAWIGPMSQGEEALFGLAALGAFAAYHAGLGAWPGRTAGMLVSGIRVAAADGSRLGLGRSAARAAAFFAALLPLGLGVAWALFRRDRRGWHDLLSGAAVLQARPKGTLQRLALAAGAWGLLAAMVAGGAYRAVGVQAIEDAEAVAAARRALELVAELQERHKAATGRYSDSLVELAARAEVPGDVHEGLSKVLLENSLDIEVSAAGYRITATARDSASTPVELSSGGR